MTDICDSMSQESGTGRAVCRRGHERLRLAPMYSAVSASRDRATTLHGHVYDISAGGVRIELDEPLDPGESVALSLDLPGTTQLVEADASVVWCHDEQDDPGPRRMALRFIEFPKEGHRQRLAEFLLRELRRAA
jgi:c-di-GMP-binding flagellar brake protein YcgR